jgi:quinol-cytochrome oxidoreductase complex cytochrome b subunit
MSGHLISIHSHAPKSPRDEQNDLKRNPSKIKEDALRMQKIATVNLFEGICLILIIAHYVFLVGITGNLT